MLLEREDLFALRVIDMTLREWFDASGVTQGYEYRRLRLEPVNGDNDWRTASGTLVAGENVIEFTFETIMVGQEGERDAGDSEWWIVSGVEIAPSDGPATKLVQLNIGRKLDINELWLGVVYPSRDETNSPIAREMYERGIARAKHPDS